MPSAQPFLASGLSSQPAVEPLATLTVQAWRPVPPGARTGAPAPPAQAPLRSRPLPARPEHTAWRDHVPGCGPAGAQEVAAVGLRGQTWCFIGRLCSAPTPLTEKWALCPRLLMALVPGPRGAAQGPCSCSPESPRPRRPSRPASLHAALPDAVPRARTHARPARQMAIWFSFFRKKKKMEKQIFLKGHLHPPYLTASHTHTPHTARR